MLGNVSLTPKQEKVIDALLAGTSIVDAAKSCGVTEQTVHRWQKDLAFQQRYNEQRQVLLNHAITALQLKFDKAVKALERHIDEKTSTIPRDQVEAAKTVINTTLQTAQLMERITGLEAKLAEQEQDKLYSVTFDLRQLTKEERETLEAIHDRIRVRTTENA